MTTTKSFSDKARFLAIFRTSLKSQIPFMIVATIVFAMLVSLVMFVALPSPEAMATETYHYDYFDNGVFLDPAQVGFALGILAMFAMIVAIIQNSYMQNKKTVDLYHSLPVRRPVLLGANMLASMVTILAPFFAVVLVTTLAELIRYGAFIQRFGWYFACIGLDLLSAVAIVAIVYTFTTFICVNVGTAFDSFALTMSVGVTPTAFVGIFAAMWSELTYGGSALEWLEHVILLLSPFTFVFQRFFYMYMFDNHAQIYNSVTGLWTSYNGMGKSVLVMLAALVVAAGFFVAAVVRYNRRKSETAEQTQPSGVLQTITKCLAGFLGGTMFFMIFREHGMFAWLIAIFAGAVLIGVIVELILSRGFRSIAKNIKWLLVSGGLCCLMIFGCLYDITGYVRRVPKPEQIESVQISTQGRFSYLSQTYGWNNLNNDYGLTSPETIAVVTEAHRLAVENRPPSTLVFGYYGGDDYPWFWTNLTYKFKNGGEMVRGYRNMNKAAILKLTELEDKDDYIRQNHALFLLEGLDNVEVRTVTLYNAIGGNANAHTIPEPQLTRLLDAMRTDMLAESLEDITNPKSAAYGFVELQYNQSNTTSNNQSLWATGTVIVGKSYTNTIAVLTELGLMGDFEVRDEITGIAVAPSRYEYGNELSVRPLVPDSSYRSGYEYDYNSYVKSENPALISAALAAGRSQMLIGDPPNGEHGAVLIHYFKDGIKAGTQLARIADLPAELRAGLDAKFDENGYLKDDAVMVPMAAVTTAIEADA